MRILYKSITALLVTATFALPAYAGADAVSEARKAIQSAYDRANAAASKKDVAGAMANHAQDYTYIDQHGKSYEMSQLKAQLSQIIMMAKELHTKTVIESISLKGATATLKIKETGHILLANPQKPDQTVKLEVESQSEDLWTKTGQGWKIKRSKGIASKQWLNGKPYTPPKQ